MEGYIMTLLASAVIVTVSSVVLPEGNVKKYAHLVSSVIISLALIAPLKSVLDISEIFEFDNIESFEMSREEAEKIYSDNLKAELENSIEEALSHYGNVYVKVSDEHTVKSIEIYTKEIVPEEEKEKIKELYQPERLEIIYGEY